jgi:hypothetical protein
MDAEKTAGPSIKRWGLIAGGLAVPVYFVVNHFEGGGTARAAAASFGLLILIIRGFWNLRRHAWYWLTIAALVLVHLLLIIVIPWTNKIFPAPELAPVGILDGLAMYACVTIVKKAMTRGKSQNAPE